VQLIEGGVGPQFNIGFYLDAADGENICDLFLGNIV
jgi:hypothetical protein